MVLYKILILYENVYCLEKCMEMFIVLKSVWKSVLYEECNLLFLYV